MNDSRKAAPRSSTPSDRVPLDHPEFDAIAKWYDFDYERRVKTDLPFYFRCAVEGGNPVLELGAGTGRVTQALALGGFDVTAVDLSEEMLARARRRFERLESARGAVHFVRGDMADLGSAVPRIRGRFGTILVPFRSFHHLVTAERQLAALRAVRRLLAPGGLAVVDLFAPNVTYFGAIEGKTKISYERRRRETGTKVVQRFRVLCDFPRQIGYIEYIWDEYKAGRKIGSDRANMRWRWIHRYEFEHLAARAGLRVVRLVGDFDGGPFEKNSEEMIYFLMRDETAKSESGRSSRGSATRTPRPRRRATRSKPEARGRRSDG